MLFWHRSGSVFLGYARAPFLKVILVLIIPRYYYLVNYLLRGISIVEFYVFFAILAADIVPLFLRFFMDMRTAFERTCLNSETVVGRTFCSAKRIITLHSNLLVETTSEEVLPEELRFAMKVYSFFSGMGEENFYLLAREERLSEEAHMDGEYRPVGVAILRDPDGKILVVRSAKNILSWGFPQGGIEVGESLVPGMMREIKEELGVDTEVLRMRKYLGHKDLDADEGRTDRRGFSKGKRYFCFLLSIDSPHRVESDALDPREIVEHQWVCEDEAKEMFSANRPEKRELLSQWLTML